MSNGSEEALWEKTRWINDLTFASTVSLIVKINVIETRIGQRTL